MNYLDLSFADPAANLACDEALLEECEAGRSEEVLRCWSSTTPFVVVGYANRVEQEVHLAVCRKRNVPVLRRCTGGGTVVQGPGCLNYSLILRAEEGGPLASITAANRHIMARQQQVISRLLDRPVQVQGHTDLVVEGRKFSGNAQRRKRHWLLFHGSFLLGLDLSLIEELLPLPSKQPGYRAGRAHCEFLTNIPVAPQRLKEELQKQWNAHPSSEGVPRLLIDRLIRDKYSRDDWNFRF